VNATDLAGLARPAGGALFGQDGPRNILDWLIAFDENPDPAAFTGQDATISGFVYRDARFGQDTFLVGRFTVSCCVADASPVGLVVRWPETESLPDNQWVEVSGRFEPGFFDGQPTPILIVTSLERIDPPRQPYLYL
jgi:putative membrane protein